jgi:hypothetical protein
VPARAGPARRDEAVPVGMDKRRPPAWVQGEEVHGLPARALCAVASRCGGEGRPRRPTPRGGAPAGVEGRSSAGVREEEREGAHRWVRVRIHGEEQAPPAPWRRT